MNLSKSLFLITLTGILGAAPIARADDFKPEVKTNAVLQTWLFNDTTTTVAKPDFRIRRAELRFSGKIIENVRYFVMADLAKSPSATGDNKILQDLGAGYTLFPGLELIAGQFKILTNAEGLEKSGELLFPERSIVGRTWGDRREQGAQLLFKRDRLQAAIAATNDTGPNQADTTGAKDLTARADYEVIDGLMIGAFTGASDFSYFTNGRSGANVRFTTGDLLIGAEGVLASAKNVSSNGYMAYAGYTLMGQWQPVIRFATINPLSNASDFGQASGPDSAQEFSLGLNYYLAKHNAKVQLAYNYLNNLVAPNGTSTLTGGNGNIGSLTTLCFQVAI